MTRGVGGSSAQQALAMLQPMMDGVVDIVAAEYAGRIARLQALMREQQVAAMVLYGGTNLRYFTGLQWRPSERLVAAVVPAQGEPHFIAPWFERGTVQDLLVLRGPLHTWHEHESPSELVHQVLAGLGLPMSHSGTRVGLDESMPYFAVAGLQKSSAGLTLFNAHDLTAHCRMRKSAAELALMQRAFDMTLCVHRATAAMLHEGIGTTEVEAFIDLAHRRVGASGSSFVIVLFGVASSFPHGVKDPQTLRQGDVVLIDTGCYVHGYTSDITRSYVFGEASAAVRRIWALEQAAQAAAFAAAQPGTPCSAVDAAARAVVTQAGLGPGYALPGIPHRTGHGIGLDIHERPYLTGNDDTPLQAGMCCSNEPMIVVPGEFGIRLEDHFYMTDTGPRWFTQPSPGVDDPFGLAALR